MSRAHASGTVLGAILGAVLEAGAGEILGACPRHTLQGMLRGLLGHF